MSKKHRRWSPDTRPESHPPPSAPLELAPGAAPPGDSGTDSAEITVSSMPVEQVLVPDAMPASGLPSLDSCAVPTTAVPMPAPPNVTGKEPAPEVKPEGPPGPEAGSAPAIAPAPVEEAPATIHTAVKPESAEAPSTVPAPPASGPEDSSPTAEALPPAQHHVRGRPTSPAPRVAESPSEEEVVKELPRLKQGAPPIVEPQEPPAEALGPPPAIPRMFVMMLTPELAPAAKVGGLADVVLGLSRELELRGNAVEIVLPKYNCMRYDHISGLCRSYENLQVPWFNGAIPTTVWFGFVHGRKCFFIEPHSRENFFDRGVFYGQNDDLLRFAFFCRAALEFMYKAGKHPEIIHCHDWQTALAPVLLYEVYAHLGMRHTRVCFTIHNFRHQGVTNEVLLRAAALNRPEHYFHYDRLRDNQNAHALNLLKGGIVYSNFVTTVSPRHAWEAKDAGQGHGLEPTLHIHHYKFGGVLNGLDYDVYNPETDPYIPSHYTARTIEKKYDNKRALRQRVLLADNEKPIVAFVGRLDAQKGLELVRHGVFYSLQNRAQFVLLGESPDRGINDHFWGLKRHFNDNPDCHLEIGYNAELANLIYAGADLILAPSRFEPCGLTQLISMRYGTVPIVRSVGGLADTVFDKDYSHRPLHDRNGYVFHHPDNAGLESALSRALGCYYHYPDQFRQLMLRGMRCDYSWNLPAQHYLNIYDHIRDK